MMIFKKRIIPKILQKFYIINCTKKHKINSKHKSKNKFDDKSDDKSNNKSDDKSNDKSDDKSNDKKSSVQPRKLKIGDIVNDKQTPHFSRKLNNKKVKSRILKVESTERDMAISEQEKPWFNAYLEKSDTFEEYIKLESNNDALACDFFIKNLVTNLQKGTETEKLTDKNCKTYNFKPSQLFYKILSIPSASYFVEITKDKQDETRPNQYIKYITIYIYPDSSIDGITIPEYMKKIFD